MHWLQKIRFQLFLNLCNAHSNHLQESAKKVWYFERFKSKNNDNFSEEIGLATYLSANFHWKAIYVKHRHMRRTSLLYGIVEATKEAQESDQLLVEVTSDGKEGQ